MFGIVITLLLMIIGLFSYITPQRQIKKYQGLDYIIDNIYLGNWDDSTSEPKLKNNDIRCMLTLTQMSHTSTEKNMFNRLGINQKHIQIQDSMDTNIIPHIDTSIQFIKDCSGNVLVHCYAGISRSVSIVIAYLMKEKKMSYWQALKYVRNRRHIANPNPSFVQQLNSI